MSLCHSRAPGTEQRRAKATLFCPACDHESPVDGDWSTETSTDRRRLLCPRCGAVVADRPRFDAA